MADPASITLPGETPAAPATPPEAPAAKPTEGQQPPAEEAKSPSPKQDPKTAARFAALTRKEKAVLETQKQAKEMMAEAQKLMADLKGQQAKTSVRPADPIAALEAAGFTYEQAAEFMLNGKQATPDQIAQRALKEVEDLKAQREKDAEERAEGERRRIQQQKDQQYQAWQDGVVEAVKAEKSERWEYTNLLDYQHMVPEVIREHYEATAQTGEPKVMSTEEAADKVEAWLEKYVARLAKSKKYGAKGQPPADGEPDGVPSSDETSVKPVGSKTLTNTHKPAIPAKKAGSYNREEARKAAIAALDAMGFK